MCKCAKGWCMRHRGHTANCHLVDHAAVCAGCGEAKGLCSHLEPSCTACCLKHLAEKVTSRPFPAWCDWCHMGDKICLAHPGHDCDAEGCWD